MTTEPDKARYNSEGEPVNLPAGAYDALEWLELFRERRVLQSLCKNSALGGTREATDACRRFERCVDILRAQVEPHLPPTFSKAEEVHG